MSQMADPAKCAICGGVEGEHANAQHQFTLVPGELLVKEPKQNPTQLPLGRSGNDPLGRLLEVLVIKGVMDLPEVLYIANLGARPESLNGGGPGGDGS